MGTVLTSVLSHEVAALKIVIDSANSFIFATAETYSINCIRIKNYVVILAKEYK